MQIETGAAETQALIANDIRLLVEQLNDTEKCGAGPGLKISDRGLKRAGR
jgi:hypothetical protein